MNFLETYQQKASEPEKKEESKPTKTEKPVAQKKWPEIPHLAPEEIESWFLKPVFQRLKQGDGQFLSDLRLVVPVFVSFTGAPNTIIR